MYKLGELFFNKKAGLVSAFILALSPMHIWYSQEARGYTMATFLTMLMVYFLFSALKRNKLYSWAGFVLSSIAGVYTNYFCFYVLAIAGIILLFLKMHRKSLWPVIISLCVVLIAFLPLVPAFIKRVTKVISIFWIPAPRLNSISITFENLNAGYNATANIYFFTFIIFSLLFILGIYAWWSQKKKK